jgi:colicin import membrane protein
MSEKEKPSEPLAIDALEERAKAQRELDEKRKAAEAARAAEDEAKRAERLAKAEAEQADAARAKAEADAAKAKADAAAKAAQDAADKATAKVKKYKPKPAGLTGDEINSLVSVAFKLGLAKEDRPKMVEFLNEATPEQVAKLKADFSEAARQKAPADGWKLCVAKTINLVRGEAVQPGRAFWQEPEMAERGRENGSLEFV